MGKNMNWTPEPWRVAEWGCHAPTSILAGAEDYHGRVYVAECSGTGRDSREGAVDAVRIVACVNACEGIEDPADYIANAERTRMALIGQRDELLGVLKPFANIAEYHHLTEAMSACLRPHERSGFLSAMAAARSAAAGAVRV